MLSTDWVYVGNAAKAHLLATDKLDSNAVAGGVSFIANGQLILSWYFANTIFRGLRDDGHKKILKIYKGAAMVMGSLAEV